MISGVNAERTIGDNIESAQSFMLRCGTECPRSHKHDTKSVSDKRGSGEPRLISCHCHVAQKEELGRVLVCSDIEAQPSVIRETMSSSEVIAAASTRLRVNFEEGPAASRRTCHLWLGEAGQPNQPS